MRRDAVSGAWSIQPVDPDATLACEQFHQPLAEAARPVLPGHARPIVRKLDHISAILRPPPRNIDPREYIGRAVDRKSVVYGNSVIVRGDLVGGRSVKK